MPFHMRRHNLSSITLAIKLFGLGGLFMKINAYYPEGGNERRRIATPTSISIFDSDDMKSLCFRFGLDIFTGFKMLILRDLQFQYIKQLKKEHPNFEYLPF